MKKLEQYKQKAAESDNDLAAMGLDIYENCPSDMFDSIPYYEDIKYWLKAVYDAFDEICNRLKITH